ncbi:MAG: hypothetical protein GYA33_02730 [Thermogutta sp.]|nr:hypothetical protein [Thermogutta sp.]
MNPCLEAALRYAALGYRLLPAAAGAKTPLIRDWPSKASRNESVIRKWFEQWPAANIGIACGGGLLVLDLDPEALTAGWPGEARRRELKATRCPLVRTPRGGWHLYFNAVRPWRNTTSVIALGVDSRGEGGFAVAPPSGTPNGRYQWVRPPVKLDQLPPPPEWLVQALDGIESRRNHPSAQAPGREEDGVFFTEGGRNAGLFRLACKYRAIGLRQDEIEAALIAANRLRCQPPLDDHEVTVIVKSASRYPQGDGDEPYAMRQAWRHAVAHRTRKGRCYARHQSGAR